MSKEQLLNQISLGDCLVLPEQSKVWANIADKVEHTPDGPFYFIEGKGAEKLPVLGIAHLDCALYTKARVRNDTVYSPTLDDRLGVWLLLKYLLPLGVDVLLTTGEEQYKSTGYWFRPTDKQYNWIFELDRAGIDCVTYDFFNERFFCALESNGWQIGKGIFTDISFMMNLGVMAVNFGIGYHLEHTENCYAQIQTVKQQLNRVLRFVRTFNQIRFDNEGKKR